MTRTTIMTKTTACRARCSGLPNLTSLLTRPGYCSLLRFDPFYPLLIASGISSLLARPLLAGRDYVDVRMTRQRTQSDGWECFDTMKASILAFLLVFLFPLFFGFRLFGYQQHPHWAALLGGKVGVDQMVR